MARAILSILSVAFLNILVGCNGFDSDRSQIMEACTEISAGSAATIKVATCQFPVSNDISKNLKFILQQMKSAKKCGADIAHFPETALSGYAGTEFNSFETFDWDLLTKSTREIMAVASQLRLWVILGSSHRLTGTNKPHNSVYIINDQGKLVDRYDKRFCTTGDLKHYSPGNHFSVFEIDGIRCGVLICHDFRYDELYRAYCKQDVRLMFHSYHNAGLTAAKLRKSNNIWAKIVPPTMQAYAANNHMWISSNNSSRRCSCWPSFFVRPDGLISGKLQNNRAGILISTIDTSADFYDASADWRDRAINGVYHSGKLVQDQRSDCRTGL